MNAVCPTCGVAVVAGYVRCPKCHTALPYAGARPRRATGDPGGTALADPRFPVSAVLIAVGVAAATILGFGLRARDKKIEAAPAVASEPAAPELAAQLPVTAGAALAGLSAPTRAAPGAQDPAIAVQDLEAALRRQRLWGRVQLDVARVNLRSGSCADPAMQPLIESKRSALHDAGLTKLRCVEQSGAVVFERDLGP
jgi:hypothetical protein